MFQHLEESVSPQTFCNYSNLSVLIDNDVSEVYQGSLRIKSESRIIASRSIITCMTQVAAIISTLFIPGKWLNRPSDEELTQGAKFTHSIAEDIFGIDMKPIKSRYISNFDDTRRHFSLGCQVKRSNFEIMKMSKKSLKHHGIKSTSSIFCQAEIGDDVTGGIKSKFILHLL